jgi:cytochrome c oxidase subunit 3
LAVISEPERPAVAHHFANIDQQRETQVLGMWVFLASEVLFFGGVFTAYAVMRSVAPRDFALASQQISSALGAINTALLLTSSFTMAVAVYAAQGARRQLLMACLGLTIAFGATFIGIKMYEWHHEYEAGLLPGEGFLKNADGTPRTVKKDNGEVVTPTADQRRGIELFFAFYFTITGLHALHMLVGVAVLGTQLALVARGSFGTRDYNPIELAGLYWHFVDIVWIFVFPLLYLLRQ